MRVRHAKPLFDKLCSFSPLVGVFGHRQVGKTTFISNEVEKYVTLDDEKALKAAETTASSFVKKNASPAPQKTAIDECQHSPKLFPALKEWVRTHKRPGQFVLTGSVRFSSRKAIRESLTGRLVSLELYPLVLSELLDQNLPETLIKLMDFRKFDSNAIREINCPTSKQQAVFEKYLDTGGLPGLCFIREKRLQIEGISALLNLIIDRDLRLVVQTNISLEKLIRFLKFIANSAWLPYRYADVTRELGIATVTQKRLLYAFEAIYLIRRIPFLASKGECFLLEDQLEECFLTNDQLDIERKIIGAIYRNVRAQFGYRAGENFQAESYRTRGGAYVPLVLSRREKRVGIIPLNQNYISLSQRRSADSFLRRHPEGKIIFALKENIKPELLESRILKTSAGSLCL